MEFLLAILQTGAGLGGFACYVLVVYAMFQNEDSTVAIVSIALLLCGCGYLIAFIMGWIKAGDYGIGNIMIVWTVFVALGALLGAVSVAV